ncbi:hypothetical protein [Fibrella aquatilis]|uniref:Uncharacterized protein n=1 Tax=Fibrella aquatilis TaxID=2817059 RepID=A0A939GDK8_9BACT|nr:hypothetical protein [Fibrella aquatilis]MBO0934746.1 hypothetical protein [Fibrella aquatilis]
MQSLLITPKDEAEFGLLSALLERMHIAATVIADDDKEDIDMGLLMQEAERSQPVSRESIFKALGR